MQFAPTYIDQLTTYKSVKSDLCSEKGLLQRMKGILSVMNKIRQKHLLMIAK